MNFTLKQPRSLPSPATPAPATSEHLSVPIDIALDPINMSKRSKTRMSWQTLEQFLTATTWKLLDKVARRDFLHSGHQVINAVRPEFVIVSTLQQLLQAEPDQRTREFFTLEWLGQTIHDAVSNGSPELWFDQNLWMYAVLLSADPPPNDRQASCLYKTEKLEQLHYLLGTAPKHYQSIPFFQALLKVSELDLAVTT